MPTRTTLTKSEYLRKAQNLKFNQGISYNEMKSMPSMGIPYWDGEEFKIESAGGGKVKAVRRSGKKNRRGRATAKRNNFDVTSTNGAAAERARIVAESRRINAEAEMFGLEKTQIEHTSNQQNARNITAGAPGDPDRLLRVPTSAARLKDGVESAVKKYNGGVYNNPAQEAITVVDSRFYDDLADPNSIPESIHINDQAALRRFRANLTKHGLAQYLQMAAKKGIRFAGFVNPWIGYTPDLLEIADQKTNNAVSKVESQLYEAGKGFVTDNAKKAVNNVQGIVKQFISAYADRLPGTTNGFDWSP